MPKLTILKVIYVGFWMLEPVVNQFSLINIL